MGSQGDESEFRPDEVNDILRFLGYPNWESLAQSIQLGFPSTSQPLFLVRDAFKRITGPSRAAIRGYLCELNDIEKQLRTARQRMKATKLGEITMRRDEASALREEYAFWRKRIADDLGVVPNPYAQDGSGGGGINAKVGVS